MFWWMEWNGHDIWTYSVHMGGNALQLVFTHGHTWTSCSFKSTGLCLIISRLLPSNGKVAVVTVLSHNSGIKYWQHYNCWLLVWLYLDQSEQRLHSYTSTTTAMNRLLLMARCWKSGVRCLGLKCVVDREEEHLSPFRVLSREQVEKLLPSGVQLRSRTRKMMSQSQTCIWRTWRRFRQTVAPLIPIKCGALLCQHSIPLFTIQPCTPVPMSTDVDCQIGELYCYRSHPLVDPCSAVMKPIHCV